MRSMIIKDLYNIGHNAKSMILVLVFMTAMLVPTSGVEGCIVMCVFLCSSMVITTFSFDENSRWTVYAMVMPISRKRLVAGKYIILLLFCAIGAVAGLVFGGIGGMVTGKLMPDMSTLPELMLTALMGIAMSVMIGATSIPLLFQFGAEKARMLLIISMMIPSGMVFLGYQLLKMTGVEMTEQLILGFLCCLPVLALVWSYGSYRISCSLFSKMELA